MQERLLGIAGSKFFSNHSGIFYNKRTQSLNTSIIYTSYMTTEMITLKLDSTFRKDLDRSLKEAGYHSRTEFIRTAIREKLEEIRMKQALIRFDKLRGSAKRTSDSERKRVRDKVGKDILKEFGIK